VKKSSGFLQPSGFLSICYKLVAESHCCYVWY